MILADTNIWVQHFRQPDLELVALLTGTRLLIHPFVVGELALGNLRDRPQTLAFLRDLPTIPTAEHASVLWLIERNGLAGRGIGYVDAHLLASLRLTSGTLLWTRDKRLRAAAEDLQVAADLA